MELYCRDNQPNRLGQFQWAYPLVALIFIYALWMPRDTQGFVKHLMFTDS